MESKVDEKKSALLTVCVGVLCIASVVASATALVVVFQPRRIISAPEFRLIDSFDRERARLSIADSGLVEMKVFDQDFKNPIVIHFEPSAGDPSIKVAVGSADAPNSTLLMKHQMLQVLITGADGSVQSMTEFPQRDGG